MTAINLTSRPGSPAKLVGSKLAVKKILVPVDFSPASENAWNYAVRFAKKFGATRLTLLHVLSPAAVLDVSGISVAATGSTFDRREAEKNLRVLANQAGGTSANKTDCVAIPGVPSHDIVEYAKESGSDLIIMATHGYTGWKHFCIGSTAERVVRAAPCPVLVVREKEYEFA